MNGYDTDSVNVHYQNLKYLSKTEEVLSSTEISCIHRIRGLVF